VATAKIFQRVREFVPDVELHVFYGLNNYRQINERRAKTYEKVLKQPGIVNHGRVGQRELYKHWFTSGLYVYATSFTETNCIAVQEAQAMGCAVITNPIWALREKCRYGSFIHGWPENDALVRARYTAAAIGSMDESYLQPQRWKYQRSCMSSFSWERAVDQWDSLISGYPFQVSQYNFQMQYLQGETVNVGCDIDAPNFGAFATNVDCTRISPVTGMETAAHVVADVRDGLPFGQEFETAILGDILEHMNDGDAVKAISNCRKVLKPGGKVIITVPDDVANPFDQHGGRPAEDAEYCPGVSAFHDRRVQKSDVESWAEKAGMSISLYRELDYGFAPGHGVVLT
jgi:SAM-dependent methyltransferase